jgi:hypothetical protein
MPRVLIATDERNFTMGMVEGYRALGWEVVTGLSNFYTRGFPCTVVHHQWPEEFAGWQSPTRREIERIENHLQWWKQRGTNIFSVNNLYPHEHDRDPAFHDLYSCFYRHSQIITHYSQASLSRVLEEFPAARSARHVVHAPPNYEVTLAIQRARGSRREQMGLRDDEFVILMLGSIRSWHEVRLIQRAFDKARIPNKRLLMAGKLKLKGSLWRARVQRLAWNWWLRHRAAVVESAYVPEDEVSKFVDSCDVAIVPRLSGLSSAIPCLAMTFGRTVIAPNHGAYPEYFQGTGNLLYETGDSDSLARQLEQAASCDLDAIGRENAIIAAKWKWKQMCETCLAAIKA